MKTPPQKSGPQILHITIPFELSLLLEEKVKETGFTKSKVIALCIQNGIHTIQTDQTAIPKPAAIATDLNDTLKAAFFRRSLRKETPSE